MDLAKIQHATLIGYVSQGINDFVDLAIASLLFLLSAARSKYILRSRHSNDYKLRTIDKLSSVASNCNCNIGTNEISQRNYALGEEEQVKVSLNRKKKKKKKVDRYCSS